MGREERMKKLQNYGEIKIKTDCFAYKESNEGLIPKKECSALTDLFCKKEKCVFYMNKEEHSNKMKKCGGK